MDSRNRNLTGFLTLLISLFWMNAVLAVEGYFMEEKTVGNLMGMSSTSYTRYYNSPLGIRIENWEGANLLESVTLLRTVNGPNNKKLLEFFEIIPGNKTYMNHDFNTVMLVGYFGSMSECDTRGCRLKPDMLTDLGEQKELNGYIVRKMRIKAGGLLKGMEADAWNTREWSELNEAIRTRWYLTIDMMEKTETETGIDTKTLYRVIDQALEKYGAMIHAETVLSPEMVFVMDVTRAKKMQLDDALFSIPPGYKKVESFWPRNSGQPAFRMQ